MRAHDNYLDFYTESGQLPYKVLSAVGAIGLTGYGVVLSAPKRKPEVINLSGSSQFNPGMPIVSPEPKRKRQKLRGNMSGAPTPAPTTKPVTTKPVQHTLNFGGVFSAPSSSKIVGDPQLVSKHGAVYFPSLKGWSFNPKRYRYLRGLYSPVTVMVGDTLTTQAATVDLPGWKYDTTSGNTAVIKNRMFLSNLVSFQKSVAQGYSAAQLIGGAINRYADLCLPLFPCFSYGELEVGPPNATYSNHKPIGVLDVWSQLKNDATTTGSYYDHPLKTLGGWPYMMENPPTSATEAIDGGIPSNTEDQAEAYVSVQFEIRLCNDDNVSQTYELYQCAPKVVTAESPLCTFEAAYLSRAEEHSALDTDTLQWTTVGRSPNEFTHFKKIWRTRKRVVTVAPGHIVTVRLGVRLSKVKYDLLRKLQADNTFCSLPGLTQWLYIRAYGCFGLDSSTGIMGTARGRCCVQMYQKCFIVNSIPLVKKKLDLTTQYKSTFVTIDEKLLQDDNEGKP